MYDGHPPKRWQNLVRRECPLCSAALEVMPYQGHLLRCSDEDCDFVIGRQTVVTILTDESHILRNFLTAEDEIRLENTVKAFSRGFDEQEETNKND